MEEQSAQRAATAQATATATTSVAERPGRKAPAAALKNIKPFHREIMRRLICGQRQVQISKELGIGQSRLSIIVNSPLFKAELAQLEKNVEARIVDRTAEIEVRLAQLEPKAVKVLEGLALNQDGKVSKPLQRASAKDLLELIDKRRDRRQRTSDLSDIAYVIQEGFKRAKEKRELESSRVIEAQVESVESVDEFDEVDDLENTTEDAEEVRDYGASGNGNGDRNPTS